MIKYFTLLSTLILFQSCSTLFKWQTEHPDNFAEEVLEDSIDNYTGYDVDLTPLTGEERYNSKQKEK